MDYAEKRNTREDRGERGGRGRGRGRGERGGARGGRGFGRGGRGRGGPRGGDNAEGGDSQPAAETTAQE